jgi:hypothetical protein
MLRNGPCAAAGLGGTEPVGDLIELWNNRSTDYDLRPVDDAVVKGTRPWPMPSCSWRARRSGAGRTAVGPQLQECAAAARVATAG